MSQSIVTAHACQTTHRMQYSYIRACTNYRTTFTHEYHYRLNDDIVFSTSMQTVTTYINVKAAAQQAHTLTAWPYTMALFTVVVLLATAAVLCLAQPNWRLKAVKDTTLESGADLGSSQYLLVGKHAGFPKKRFVVQFEDISRNCSEVIRAVMYLKYAYAHKDPNSLAPLVTRNLCVHQVLREWDENTIGSKTYMSENTDYNRQCVEIVTMTRDSIEGQLANEFVPFDITEVAKAWVRGDDNYGVLVRDMNEDVLGHDRRFHSSESPTEDCRPYMDITCSDICKSEWIIGKQASVVFTQCMTNSFPYELAYTHMRCIYSLTIMRISA